MAFIQQSCGSSPVVTADSSANAIAGDVVGNKEDAAAAGPVTAAESLMAYTKQVVGDVITAQADILTSQAYSGSSVVGRAVTAVLFVSPNGSGADGKTWTTAYTRIQDALDAASTDANECTLIIIGINTGTDNYDIYEAGDPTWTGNYILKGSHRTWAKIKNTHASATSIMKFTGYTSLMDLNFNLHTGSANGIILTKGAFRLSHVQFVGETLGGAATALHIEGATLLKHGKLDDVHFLGHPTFMQALLIENASRNNFNNVAIHSCLTGIHITNAGSDLNSFDKVDIGDCSHVNGVGIDIDAGNTQHFNNITFHDNTKNVDDTIGDSVWNNINSEFDVTLEPDNFSGVTVATHANGDTWTTTPVEIRAAITATKPYKIVATVAEGSASEKFRIRFSSDSGATWFDDISIESRVNASKRVASVAPTATDHIFNKGTQIVASSKSESGNNSAVVWLNLQEI